MQCTVCAGDYSPRSMFPSVDDRPKMHDIMAGTDQKYSYVGVWLGFLLALHLALFFCPVVRPMVRCIMAGMDQSNSMSVLGWFARESAPRAGFLPVVRPKMRCIMSVMDQKVSLLAVACARLVLLVFYTSHAVFPVAAHRP